jgi:hypothetical protein
MVRRPGRTCRWSPVCEDAAPRALTGQDGRVPRLPSSFPEAEHAANLMAATGTVHRRLWVSHSAAGLRRLRAAVAEQEPAARAVLVALERPDGLLVDALLETGCTVWDLNPKAVERYRARTRTVGAKSDPASRRSGLPAWRSLPGGLHQVRDIACT